MKTLFAGSMSLFLALAGCGSSADASCTTLDSTCPTTTPSYATDVAPVIETYCTTCHVSGGEESGLPLTSLAQVQAHADQIGSEVSGCSMPPSEEDQPTDAEKQALAAWIACGAPDN